MTVIIVATGAGPGRGWATAAVAAAGGRRAVAAMPHPPIGSRKNSGADTQGSQTGACHGRGADGGGIEGASMAGK